MHTMNMCANASARCWRPRCGCQHTAKPQLVRQRRRTSHWRVHTRRRGSVWLVALPQRLHAPLVRYIARTHYTRSSLRLISPLSCSLVDAGHATPSGAVGMRSTGRATAAETGAIETTRRAGRHERVCTAVGATTPLPHCVLLSSHTTSTLNVVDACTHTHVGHSSLIITIIHWLGRWTWQSAAVVAVRPRARLKHCERIGIASRLQMSVLSPADHTSQLQTHRVLE